MASPLITKLRVELQRIADSGKAPQMQAYMKSEMPYHGVPLPLLRKTCKRIFSEVALDSPKEWQSHVMNLWNRAKFREERYGALILAGDRRAQEFQKPEAMEMYEELIVSGAWWDFVDDIAIHRIGPILANYKEPIKKKLLSWSKSKDLWKRRSSIICQISLKRDTDLKLLYSCIEPSLKSDEFFLRKAIGWALRQVAWRDPDEVIRYVKRKRELLSPLSKREALKNIIKGGRLRSFP